MTSSNIFLKFEPLYSFEKQTFEAIFCTVEKRLNDGKTGIKLTFSASTLVGVHGAAELRPEFDLAEHKAGVSP